MIVAIQLETTSVHSNSLIPALPLFEPTSLWGNLLRLLINAVRIAITCPSSSELNYFMRPRLKHKFALHQRTNLLTAKLVPRPIFFLTGGRAIVYQVTSAAFK
eukprot:scaffold15396_cov150-Skeletonema_marinoi.AAC.1